MSHRRSITYDKGLFHLRTEHSSYMFRVTPQGQLEHLHYGAPVRDADAEALALKRTMPYGDSVLYPGGGAPRGRPPREAHLPGAANLCER